MFERPIGIGRAWAVTLVATATMAISYLDRQVLAVLAPTVTEELRIDETAYGWLASAFSIAYLVSAPLAGRLLERTGIRGGLFAAVLVWTVVSAAHAGVPGYGALFALRLALGTAESPSFPGAASTIARVLPPEHRSRGLGVLFTGSSFGAMVAPALATGLAGVLGGWRGAFIGVALVGLLWVPLWLVVTGPREVRAALASASGPASPRTSLLSTLAHPAVLRASALVLAVSPVFAFALLWGSKLLHDAHHIAQDDVDRDLWLPPLLFDVGSVAFGWLASRSRDPRWLVAVALAMALLLGLAPLSPSPWATTVLLGVAMAGGGGAFAILTSEMIGRVGAGFAATAGGATAAAQSLAYIAANPLIGWGVSSWGGYDTVMVLIAVWIVPGAVVWLVLGRRGGGAR